MLILAVQLTVIKYKCRTLCNSVFLYNPIFHNSPPPSPDLTLTHSGKSFSQNNTKFGNTCTFSSSKELFKSETRIDFLLRGPWGKTGCDGENSACA